MERGFDLGRALGTSGIVGLLIVAAGIALIALAVFLLAMPVRRRPFELLMCGYSLVCVVPFVLGWLGRKQCEALNEHVLATLKEPTAMDRERGEREAQDVFVLGALSSIPGALLIPVVWLRRRRDLDAPHTSSAV